MKKLYLDKFIKGKLMGKLMLKELKVVPCYVNQKALFFLTYSKFVKSLS